MQTIKRTVAAAELVLIFPAALFMTALVVRAVQPVQFEPAHTAQPNVDWYAARPRVGLWRALITLPLAVLLTGVVTLLRSWTADAEFRQAARAMLALVRAHLAILLVAMATLAAGGILAIVAVHVLTD
jgi:hypothetical protein